METGKLYFEESTLETKTGDGDPIDIETKKKVWQEEKDSDPGMASMDETDAKRRVVNAIRQLRDWQMNRPEITDETKTEDLRRLQDSLEIMVETLAKYCYLFPSLVTQLPTIFQEIKEAQGYSEEIGLMDLRLMCLNWKNQAANIESLFLQDRSEESKKAAKYRGNWVVISINAETYLTWLSDELNVSPATPEERK